MNRNIRHTVLFPMLGALNVMRLATPESAILSAVIFNALIIVALGDSIAINGVGFASSKEIS